MPAHQTPQGSRRVGSLGNGRTRALLAVGCVLAVAAAVCFALLRSGRASSSPSGPPAAAATSVPAQVTSPRLSTAAARATTTRGSVSAPGRTGPAAPSSPSKGAAAPPVQPGATNAQPPAQGGYFRLQPVGTWSTLPNNASCANRVRYSTWEPRPDNGVPNHVMPDAGAVHRALAARPVATGGAADPRWDSWLLQRVDGRFTGTTDEIFQWAACKWGLPDDLLRAIAVRESTWYEYEIYPSGRPILNWGMGDMMPAGTSGASVYCKGIAAYGRDFQRDFGTNICPRTFSIAGVMSWEAPSWGQMPANQNGTFPFTVRSTAFALDYLASQLRGCFNGWEYWLKDSGSYAAGDLWGCVGAWYSGDWLSSDANGYISRVRTELANFTWLEGDWPTTKPSCDKNYGCPVGSH
ncbi:MAG: hypothetical protein QOG07_1305 [Pseudonocardiales bacterium]|nr:hypothetical protein [Pseudonocardiales bacterium]